MTTPCWRTMDDFMKDIWDMSEMECGERQHVEEPTPASIVEYRTRMATNNDSVFDRPGSHDDDVTYIISGRGRGGISQICRQGVSDLSDSIVTLDVQRKIREVSGLGYSNELIEQGVKAMTLTNKEKNTKLTSSQNGTKKSPCKTSGLASPLENDRSSSASSLSSASSHSEQEDGTPTRAPPLSVLRKRAAEERREKLKQEVEGAVASEGTSGKSFGSKQSGSGEKSQASGASPRRNNGRVDGASPRRSQERGVIELGSNERPRYRNGNSGLWQNSAGSRSSSDEAGAWRRRTNSPNRFFQKKNTDFRLDTNDFPALK